MSAIFDSKMTSEYDRNGQKVEILKTYKGKDRFCTRYLVRFPDGYELKVMAAELDFGY